ncbi:universal stress protein [Haloarcula laminariae]|uniref:universal stress protein n=1 Tax=Haloarcula laminariae TaxID=2961577 RepID=UPI0021C7E486|nr:MULTISPECIES: universal stress protein [Halomicroarcula]
MALETVLLVGRPGDEGHGTKLAEAATDIAKPANARVIVGQIFTDDEYENALASLGLTDEVGDLSAEIAREHGIFSSMTAELDEAGVDYELRTAVGQHANSIVDMAADADLVIIGGAKRSPAGKAVFGSSTQDVLLEAPCPVVFVRRE